MRTFDELGVAPVIQRALVELGFEMPMPVQAEVIPQLLEQTKNIIGLAQTGTEPCCTYYPQTDCQKSRTGTEYR